MNQKDQFAKKLREARKRLGLSQSIAAKKWQVPLKNLQNWEQGIVLPTGTTLLRLLPLLSAPKSSTSTPKVSG
jgi:DNA-binding transcriptional regulator YiaG